MCTGIKKIIAHNLKQLKRNEYVNNMNEGAFERPCSGVPNENIILNLEDFNWQLYARLNLPIDCGYLLDVT